MLIVMLALELLGGEAHRLRVQPRPQRTGGLNITKCK